MERRGAFDYILLETTGLADPGNLAPLFWQDDALGASIYLDGIVTLVDAKNILLSLDEPAADEQVSDDTTHTHAGELLSTAHLQLSHADVIVLNKTDLVSALQLEEVKGRVRAMNSLARLHTTTRGELPVLEGVVLDLHAYEHVGAEALDFAGKGHSHLDPRIGTICLDLPPLDVTEMRRLDEWLRAVLWEGRLPGGESEEYWEIHRSKGRIVMVGGGVKMLQGVRQIFEIEDTGEVVEGEGKVVRGKIVLIGKGIGSAETEHAFQTNLVRCLSGP